MDGDVYKLVGDVHMAPGFQDIDDALPKVRYIAKAALVAKARLMHYLDQLRARPDGRAPAETPSHALSPRSPFDLPPRTAVRLLGSVVVVVATPNHSLQIDLFDHSAIVKTRRQSISFGE